MNVRPEFHVRKGLRATHLVIVYTFLGRSLVNLQPYFERHEISTYAGAELENSVRGFQKFDIYVNDPTSLSFLFSEPSVPQNPWVSFYTFQKSVGSLEPTEPMLNRPLR